LHFARHKRLIGKAMFEGQYRKRTGKIAQTQVAKRKIDPLQEKPSLWPQSAAGTFCCRKPSGVSWARAMTFDSGRTQSLVMNGLTAIGRRWASSRWANVVKSWSQQVSRRTPT
jgi:hypothetical protein